jgi:hypothetical protein
MVPVDVVNRAILAYAAGKYSFGKVKKIIVKFSGDMK